MGPTWSQVPDPETRAGVTPSSREYPPLNALRYGCDPTGATSSSTCLQNLGKVLHAQGGGTAIIPCGTYVATNIKYPYNGIFLQGTGSDCVLLENNGSNTPLLTFGDNQTQYYGGGLSGITFGGARGITGSAGQTAFTIQKVGKFRIENVAIGNRPTALYRGAQFVNDTQFRVDWLQVGGAMSDGITIAHSTDSYISNTLSDGNGGDGWVLDTVHGPGFVNDSAFNNAGVGLKLLSANPAAGTNANLKIVSFAADTNGNDNIQINDCKNCYFIQTWASLHRSARVNPTANGIHIRSAYSKGIVFTAGEALNGNSHGVFIDDPGNSAPTNISFVDFQFGSTVNGANGNGRSREAGYGLYTNGAVDHVRVVGGTFAGNTTGPALFSGTGTDIVCSGNPVGFVCVNQGTSAVPTSASSVTVSHGLGFTPSLANIQITPTSNMAASSISTYWVSAVSSTTFTVSTNTIPLVHAFSFAWRAAYNGN